jgi:hypothetical protein
MAFRRGVAPVTAAALHFNALSTGFAAMAAVMLGSRVFAPYFGAGIDTWAALIATALLALAAGYVLGGLAVARWPAPRVLGALLAAAGLWLAALPFASGPLLLALSHPEIEVRWGALAAALILFAPPVGLMGCHAPFAPRLMGGGGHGLGALAGRLHALATLGGVLGTVLTPYWLLTSFGTRAVTWGVGTLVIAGAIPLLLPLDRFSPRPQTWAAMTRRLLPVLAVAAALAAAVTPAGAGNALPSAAACPAGTRCDTN